MSESTLGQFVPNLPELFGLLHHCNKKDVAEIIRFVKILKRDECAEKGDSADGHTTCRSSGGRTTARGGGDMTGGSSCDHVSTSRSGGEDYHQGGYVRERSAHREKGADPGYHHAGGCKPDWERQNQTWNLHHCGPEEYGSEEYYMWKYTEEKYGRKRKKNEEKYASITQGEFKTGFEVATGLYYHQGHPIDRESMALVEKTLAMAQPGDEQKARAAISCCKTNPTLKYGLISIFTRYCRNCYLAGSGWENTPEHSLAECRELGNPCNFPCRICGDGVSMHWDDDCPRDRRHYDDAKWFPASTARRRAAERKTADENAREQVERLAREATEAANALAV